jgi:Uncharacterized protein conserved in bacteria
MYNALTTNLMVENVGKAIEFYKDILGFSVDAAVPDEKGAVIFAILSKDKVSLMVQDKGSLVSEYSVLDTKNIKPSITLYFVIDDFDERYKELNGKYPIYVEPHVTPYGAREFAILDPDGYPLTFAAQQD